MINGDGIRAVSAHLDLPALRNFTVREGDALIRGNR